MRLTLLDGERGWPMCAVPQVHGWMPTATCVKDHLPKLLPSPPHAGPLAQSIAKLAESETVVLLLVVDYDVSCRTQLR